MASERETRCDEATTTVREARVDFARLAPIDKLARTPTGGIRVNANVGREGVLVYQRQDGSVRREYRPADEAFAAASLESIADAVVTVGHPPDALVTPRTVRTYQVGHVRGAAKRDGKMISAELAVLDEDAIGKIATGELVELSCGYTCIVDATPGTTPSGEAYDVVQRDVAYNHVALLGEGQGRAGRDAKLRFDGAEVRLEAIEEPEPRNDAMKEWINGREYTVGTPEWAAANALRMKRLDELEKAATEGGDLASKVDELTKAKEGLTKELADARAKIDELTKKLSGEAPPDEKKLDSLVEERAAVREVARRVLGADAKLEGKTNDALRREVITKLDGAAVLMDGDKPRPPEFVQTYFEGRARSLASSSTSSSPVPAFAPLAPRGDAGFVPAPAPVDHRHLYTPPGRR